MRRNRSKRQVRKEKKGRSHRSPSMEFVSGARQSLFEVCIESGLERLGCHLEQDRDELCAPEASTTRNARRLAAGMTRGHWFSAAARSRFASLGPTRLEAAEALILNPIRLVGRQHRVLEVGSDRPTDVLLPPGDCRRVVAAVAGLQLFVPVQQPGQMDEVVAQEDLSIPTPDRPVAYRRVSCKVRRIRQLE